MEGIWRGKSGIGGGAVRLSSLVSFEGGIILITKYTIHNTQCLLTRAAVDAAGRAVRDVRAACCLYGVVMNPIRLLVRSASTGRKAVQYGLCQVVWHG